MVLNDGPPLPDSPSKPFTLRGSNKEFAERQKNVFDQLNTLQCNLRTDQEMELEPAPISPRPPRATTRHFRGKESIFKVPQEPVSMNNLRRIPDFKKNPHKWKKYSLADVKDDDMSESSNTKTALSFLNELRKRSHEDEEDDDEQPKKIVFKKKVVVEKTVVAEEEKPSFRSSTVVMPEYVVGQKVKKEKKSKTPKERSSKELKLDHLYDDEDE